MPPPVRGRARSSRSSVCGACARLEGLGASASGCTACSPPGSSPWCVLSSQALLGCVLSSRPSMPVLLQAPRCTAPRGTVREALGAMGGVYAGCSACSPRGPSMRRRHCAGGPLGATAGWRALFTGRWGGVLPFTGRSGGVFGGVEGSHLHGNDLGVMTGPWCPSKPCQRGLAKGKRGRRALRGPLRGNDLGPAALCSGREAGPGPDFGEAGWVRPVGWRPAVRDGVHFLKTPFFSTRPTDRQNRTVSGSNPIRTLSPGTHSVVSIGSIKAGKSA